MSLVAVVLAPLFEELGWRGYGVDSLNRKGRSLLTSTLIFSLLWNLWHLPLFFIKGYYHYEILHTNIFYAFNFVVSIFPAALLSNWIFYTNNRSILAVIIFHSILNLCSVLLQTEQFTKGIITLILLLLSGLIVFRNKELFMKIEDVKRVKL
ncbi:MAG: CPBP family intramembrane metalloprotease [Saprospiraceae bacterium]|nr:CPBP family intramembrane metalloprotease [Saprospiraceae bacterium]